MEIWKKYKDNTEQDGISYNKVSAIIFNPLESGLLLWYIKKEISSRFRVVGKASLQQRHSIVQR